MMRGRRRDRRGLQFTMRGEHLMHRTEALASELAGHGVSPVQVRVDHSEQPHRFTLLFEFLVNSGMIASKNAHAHDGDGNRTLGWQEKFSMASCRKRIVNVSAGKSICPSRGRGSQTRSPEMPACDQS